MYGYNYGYPMCGYPSNSDGFSWIWIIIIIFIILCLFRGNDGRHNCCQ